MKLHVRAIKLHTPEESKEVVERLLTSNIETKLGSYLNKLDWEDVEWILDLKVDKIQ